MPFPNLNLEKHLDGKSKVMLLNMKLNPRADDPVAADLVEFVPWFNTTTNQFKYYDGDRILTLQSLLEPVINAVSTLPVTARSGDRYLLKNGVDTAPEIHEYKNGAWEKQLFKHQDTVFDTQGVKYIRLGLNLDYEALTIVSDRDPVSTDFDYKEGVEWRNLVRGETFKLLRSDPDGKVLIGSSIPSTAPNPSTRYMSGGARQYFTPQVSGEINRVSVLFASTVASFNYSLSLFKRNIADTADELLTTSPLIAIPQLTTPSVIDFDFANTFVESGTEYWVNFSPTSTAYYLERNQDLIPNGRSQIGQEVVENDLSVEIEIANPSPTWISLKDLIPKVDVNQVIASVLGVVTTLPATATKSDRYILKIDQDTAPEIHEYSGTEWIQETFEDKNVVFDSRGTKYIRLGTRLEHQVSTIVAQRLPTENDNAYPLGQEWELEGKTGTYKLLDLETLGTSNRQEDYGYTSNSNVYKRIPATENGRYWQSFPVTADGGLEQVSLNFFEGLSGTGSPDHELLVELYEGVGIQGTILSSFKQTITRASRGSNFYAFYFPTTLAVRTGETYTWAISRTVPVADVDNLGVNIDRTGLDPLAGQSNDGNHSSYSFVLRYIPWSKASWVKLKNLIPEVQNLSVQGILNALPIVTTNGDRYIIKSDEADTPKIFEYNSGAWLQKPFEDKNSVYVRDSAAYYVRLGTRLERHVGTEVRDRAPVDTDIDYPVGQEWEWKSVGRTWKLLKKEAGVATWVELEKLIPVDVSDKFITATAELEIGNDYDSLGATHSIKVGTPEDEGKLTTLWANGTTGASTITTVVDIEFNDDTPNAPAITIESGQLVQLRYDHAIGLFKQLPVTGASSQVMQKFKYIKFEWDLGDDKGSHRYSMTGGHTIIDGVTLYPEAAAELQTKLPTWISGNNIVIPNWRDRFPALIGNDGSLGALQTDTTAVNGLRFNNITAGNSVSGGNFASSGSSNTPISGSRLSLAGDSKTRPENVRLNLSVIMKQSAIAVDADLIPVEDGSDVIWSGGGTITLYNGLTWQNIKDDYDHVRISVRHGTVNCYSGTIESSELVNNLVYRNGISDNNRFSLTLNSISNGTATLGVSGGTLSRVRLIAVKAPLTAVHPESAAPGTITVPSSEEWVTTQDASDRYGLGTILQTTKAVYFQNSWIARDLGVIPGLTKDANNHYLCSQDKVLELMAVFQGAEGGGLTVGMSWQQYAGYWYNLNRGSNTQNNPESGGFRFTEFQRVFLKTGEYLRFLTYIANGGSNTYPGNRNVFIQIREV